MGNRISEVCWEKQSGVMLWYALIYSAIRPFSTSYWPIVFGLRIACLFLLPRRYWFALVLGEVIPLTYFNMECLNDFGMAWVVANSIPPIAMGMPVVWWFHGRAKLFPARNLVDVKLLLCCTLALSVLWALVKCAVLLIGLRENGHSGHLTSPPLSFFTTYLLTYYTTFLAVVPWIIMFRLRKPGSKPTTLQALSKNPFLRDVAVAATMLVALSFLHHFVAESAKLAVVAALFLPAVWLTLKHGWRASVLGGTFSLIDIAAVLKWQADTSTSEQTQFLFMAFAITCLYVFGARISAQSRQHEQAQHSVRETQNVAQSALVFGEQRLQQTSQALECVAGILRLDHAHVLEHYVPGPKQVEFGKQAMHLQQQVFRLAENIHPSAWRERGLAAALDETIGHALEDADIVYSCQTPGRGLRSLSTALQTAVYRTACEAVARLCASPACTYIHLDIRIWHRDNIRCVVLRIRSTESDINVANATLNAVERERLAPKLGASMKSFNEMRQLTRIFAGELRRRNVVNGTRITALLCDEASQIAKQAPIPMATKLWVG